MRKRSWIWLFLLVFGFALVAFGQEDTKKSETFVNVITIADSINPGTSDFIIRSIQLAQKAGAEALVIELDTPGGLVESTRDIVQELLASKLPVVVYVSPPGAHAGSAGVMITLAADLAVMAPGTNIGAASPVSGTGEMDETMQKKVTNDIASWVKSIAEKRGRNEKWAVKAVTEAASVTATEALKLNVIDLIADDLPSLLASIDGKKVTTQGKEKVLKTKNAQILRQEMGIKHKLISRLADPNLVYLFMIIGFLGLYIELSNPGLIFPGVVGGICLILFLMATQVLPINTLGLILFAAGIVLFILEIKIASYGMLTIGGLICLTIGSLILFDVPEKIVDYPSFNLQVSWSYIIPSILVVGGFVAGITFLIIRAHKRQVETGTEGIIGKIGQATTDITPEAGGRALVMGEIWNVDADETIEKGRRVMVTHASKSELRLTVKKHP